jgi:ParB-like chromosome segregation protein Spo0J
MASVRERGILHPPLLLSENEAGFVVLSGARRLRALRLLGGQETVCRVAPQDIDQRAILLLLLDEHQWHSPLTMVEKVFFLALAARCSPSQSLADEFIQRLALPRHGRQVMDLLKLLELPPEILRDAHNGRLSIATAFAMTALAADDRQAIAIILTQTQMGDNKQNRFMQLLAAAAELRQQSQARILDMPEIAAIVSDQAMNGPQKAQRLLDALAALASPDLCAAERQFAKWQSGLALPVGARVEHSPAFESDALRLILPFGGRPALEEFWRRMRPQDRGKKP